METSVVTDPVPAVEEPEITSAATTGPGPAEPTASDGSGGGDGNEASCRLSLSEDEQVHNLKENWEKAFALFAEGFRYMREPGFHLGDKIETNPWFASVVEKLRVDPCLENSEFEIDQSVTGRHVSGVKMTSLDLAILMGDLKMVQKILVDPERALEMSSRAIYGELVSSTILRPLKRTLLFFTPLHLAVVGGNSDIVDVLLEKGVDVNAKGCWTQTPLDLACKMENFTMLSKLLEKDTKEGKHPLHVAVRYGNIKFLEKELAPDVNVKDHKGRTPLHYLAISPLHNSNSMRNTLGYLANNGALDMNALDNRGLSAFYLAILYGNTKFVFEVKDSWKDEFQFNEACNNDLGPPIQIAFEGGYLYKDIERALMECGPVKGYVETLYRDRQVYVDAANAILVGAALIASVTFASWLQPPLSYTSYFGEGSSSSVPGPSTSDLNYVDVEHNIALRAFWVFNALSFYFSIATVVCGARSVLPRSHLFIKKTVEKLRTNLLVTSILLACSVLFVIVAFAIAGTIVLTPLLKYQWYMIVPTIVGGTVCIISLVFLVKSMAENYYHRHFDERWDPISGKKLNLFLRKLDED